MEAHTMVKIHCDDIAGHRKWGLDDQKYLPSRLLLTECQNAGIGRPPGCGKASTLWHTQEKLRLEIHSLCTRAHCQEPLHCAQFSQHNNNTTTQQRHKLAHCCSDRCPPAWPPEFDGGGRSLPRSQKCHMISEIAFQASFPTQGSADPTGHVVLRFGPAWVRIQLYGGLV